MRKQYLTNSASDENGPERTQISDGTPSVGIYANLFAVEADAASAAMMQIDRSQLPDLRSLRDRFHEAEQEVQLAAAGGIVYGYGREQALLLEKGFEPVEINLLDVPRLATHVMSTGYAAYLTSAGYICKWGHGHFTATQLSRPVAELPGGLRLYRGFRIQATYLWDPEDDGIFYGFVVDPTFSYQDAEGHALRTDEVVNRFGSEALKTLRMRQGDLAPRGGINLEVSRQRLVEMIQPFLNARDAFPLPTGGQAVIGTTPTRIVLSAKAES